MVIYLLEKDLSGEPAHLANLLKRLQRLKQEWQKAQVGPVSDVLNKFGR
jgi:hypothetical protein